MQTLGISDSTVRTESRLKSLFWPSIQTGTDVDYLGTQGFWVCAIISIVSLLLLVLARQPIVGLFVFFVYYFGGVGVRERDPFAAMAVLLVYVIDTVFTILLVGLYSPAQLVIRPIIIALLISNLRATFMAWSWRPDSEEAALPQRQGVTFTDKLSDQFPMWIWPKVRIVYYIYALLHFGFICLGMLGILLRGLVRP